MDFSFVNFFFKTFPLNGSHHSLVILPNTIKCLPMRRTDKQTNPDTNTSYDAFIHISRLTLFFLFPFQTTSNWSDLFIKTIKLTLLTTLQTISKYVYKQSSSLTIQCVFAFLINFFGQRFEQKIKFYKNAHNY